MNIYTLEPDEVVIMQDTHVRDADSGEVTLVLTNKSIIQVNKGFFGKAKDFEKYSLLDLKEYKGKPNVLVGKDSSNVARLELYFSTFEKYYYFHAAFRERKWASSINKAYKTCAAEKRKVERTNAGGGFWHSPVKNTIQLNKKTVKCPRCGAELAGEKGTSVVCEYCDAVVTIK